ncbi:tetratricopeptide repeat protein [Falsiroseomonas sp. HW251]|uniref:tetratricopeptide repeat protein n=1 Tax=Falsiroseomonas sp. HW251 TaxID=3390998 RepID=UPI003D3124FD
MPDIFDEVEEDLRADRARRLARKWGGVALGVAIAALAATGGLQAWRWNESRQAAAAAATYLTLHRGAEREGADLATAANGFAALSRESPEGYRTLSRLRAAALKAETGDNPAAQQLWNEVAGDTAADPLYRDLATLLSVMNALDSGDPAQLAARIAPLTVEGNPWRASAREAQALIALRRGQTEEARRILQALMTDANAPPGVRERAQRVSAGLRS